ncbi:hypothetical protein ASG36_14555 [Geodermatophilus sp. Leaf369]|uniref:hypothetical protein n=1 Tax=Geodermatophilus sp. Leaf369 TaxID=1736354 RepID=UPI0006F5FB33|nr:hypothetical protein [Geodermatophilus sp. Leaf369]KQS57811.1 hypothetical protein ASG36_14555 [Geodermatophilus sp. Leaf369]
MTGTLRSALALLRRHAGPAYLAALLATLVNTVPDVGRKVLVWDDPSGWHALAVAVVGVLTAAVAQLWVTGVVAGLTHDGSARWSGALRRGTGLAWVAVRRAPRTVLAGLVTGGAVSALLTLPASVAALGLDRLLGPLDSPAVGAFAVAAVSDVVASVVTLPFLAFVLVLAGSREAVGPGGGLGRDRG